MSRRLLAILILVAWVGSLGWLAAREWGRRGKILITGRQVVSPGAAYYRIQLGADQTGYSLLQVDTLPPTDTSPALVQLQHRVLLSTGAGQARHRYEIYTTAWLTTDLRLWRSETLRGDTTGVAQWKLRVDGDSLHTLFVIGTDSFRSAMRLDSIPVPVEAVPLYIATYLRPRPGQAISLPTIDLTTLARRHATWTATAESTFTLPDSVEKLRTHVFHTASFDTVRAYRLSGTDRSVQVHTWIDENGYPIEWWTGGGLLWERDAFESSLDAFRFLSDSADGRSPLETVAGADAPTLRIRQSQAHRLFLKGAEYPILEAAGPTQRLTGDTVETFEPNSWRGQQAFRPLEPLPMSNSRLLPELEDEPRASPEDTLITARALAIRGSTQNAREMAIALQGWVRANITVDDPNSTLGGRPAGVVLARGHGTPEEIATLTVALARRVGLPARTVGGFILTPRGLRVHTWTELFIGDWVPVDPTQATFSASPAHVRLLTGGTGTWTDLYPLAAALLGNGATPVELP